MLGVIVLLIALGVEVGFMIYSLMTKAYQKDKKSIVRIAAFVLFTLLSLIGVIWWGFRWYMFFFILLINAFRGIWYFIKRKTRKEKTFRNSRVIMSGIGSCLLLIFAIMPAIMFPQFKLIEKTGDYKIETVSYTLTDSDRMETFSDVEENRKVTIQFWYPDNDKEQYPLVVFSHGAFGFRGSNASTFEELASNGYIVCSIDYTYHSFYSKQTDGNTVIANMDFINNAMAVENGEIDVQTTYELTHEWLTLRLEDMNFVLNDIIENVNKSNSDSVYQLIDINKIGVLGHSLGGATSAAIGRERTDIDAVIVVDGTMFGEETSFENGEAALTDSAYPVPILNMYNEDHYNDAMELGNAYPNVSATNNGVDARQMVIHGSGHLNFTDLPMFSPALASLLGTGEVDSRYCIETMNEVVLNYFNYYLKDATELDIKAEY
jgi:dienelactone hydrolase